MRRGTRDCVPAAASGVGAAGALRFGRYAFPPNQLGYCGPDDHAALLEYVARAHPDRGLVELERRFEGAYQYLALTYPAGGRHGVRGRRPAGRSGVGPLELGMRGPGARGTRPPARGDAAPPGAGQLGRARAAPTKPVAGSGRPVRGQLREPCRRALDEVLDRRFGDVVHGYPVDLATERAQRWFVGAAEPEG